MAKPINVVIKGDYNDKDVNRAIRDLNSLKTQAGVSSGAMGGLNKSMVALGGVMAAAFSATAVVDFFKSAAEGALADEAAMKSLAVSLENVNQGYRSTDVNQFIDSMSMASGIADDVLRPALQQLVTVTGDVTKSQDALTLATNVAAGSSRTISEVSAALSAAYSGNFTAITRLKTGIDANIIATKDMDRITAALSERYKGQASAAADSYQGRLAQLSVVANEAKEQIGYALLGAVSDVADAMGGTGGAAQAAKEMANGLSGLIGNVGKALALIAGLGTETAKTADIQDEYSTKTLRDLLGLLGPISLGTREMLQANEDAARAEGEHAKSLQVLSDRYMGVASAAIAARAAMDAAKQKKAVDTIGDRLTAYARTFDGVSISQTGGNLSTYFNEVAASASSAGGSMAAAAEVTKVKWGEAAAAITTSLDGAVVTMKGKGVELGGALAEGYQSRLDAFQGIVDKQVGIITSARQALDDYAKSVTSTVMGNISFQTTGVDAEGKTVALTPEQIVQMVLGDVTNQTAAVNAIGQIATKIPEALAKQMLAMDPQAAIGLANYLADPVNSATVVKLNENYLALATLTETTLGVPMAAAWATVGGESAVSMIAKAKETIADEAASFRKWVRSNLATTITVKVEYDTSGAPSGIPGRALGGPVVGGTPYIVGENGPELFVPGRSGSIVPNDVLAGSASRGSSGGGNTYAINVQAGVGDPRQIGQQVVEYIKRFEASNSASWRAA